MLRYDTLRKRHPANPIITNQFMSRGKALPLPVKES